MTSAENLTSISDVLLRWRYPDLVSCSEPERVEHIFNAVRDCVQLNPFIPRIEIIAARNELMRRYCVPA
jgi:hypothetical protein